MRFVFLCDKGFGEKKENIKWLEYEVKLIFSVKATFFQINFVVKFIRRPRRSSFMVSSNMNGISTNRTGYSSAETSA